MTSESIMIMLTMEQQNPYQFIVDTDHTKKKPLIPAGSSKQTRILVVLAGLFVLLIFGYVIMTLLSSASNAGKAEVLKVAQQQTEIIRISKIGLDRAQSTATKNLAMTTNLSLQSDQATLVSAAKASGATIATSELVLGKNAKTDTVLTTAEQSNKFDEVFTKTLQAQLTEYQKSLKIAYDKADNKKLKQTLSDQFTSAGLLATAK